MIVKIGEASFHLRGEKGRDQMGVKNLWDILESCKKTLPLHHLQNKRVCIDLSCWMVQLQSVSKSHGGFKDKFYLKGLFHRLRALIALNCSLIFVTDGSIPAIKLATYRKRLNLGHEISQDETNSLKACSLRRNVGSEFSCMIKEAKMLGLALGVPCLDGIEEAEAQCASLNSESLCDGCFTSDSDIFLFGARTVYRDICLGEGGHVVCYEMADIEKILGFGRNSLIAWALLLGSDYSPGVTGFGPESTCRILKSVGEENILKKIVSEGSFFVKRKTKNSKKNTQVPQCSKKPDISDVDTNFSGNNRACEICDEHHSSTLELCSGAEPVKNSRSDNDLERQKQFLLVIDAYLKPKCHLADSEKVYKVLAQRPFQHNNLRLLCSEFFGWPPEKTDEYILPKIAERDLQRFANLRLTSSAQGVNLSLCKMPVKCPVSEIVKRRKVQGKECFEVLWEGYDGLKTSVVSADLVERACPERITEFEEKIAQKKKPRQRRPMSKKTKNTPALTDIELNLQRILQDLDLETDLSSNPSMLSKASIENDRGTAAAVSVDGRHCNFQNSELDNIINDCSNSVSCHDVDQRLEEYELIDLVSPSPVKCQTISRLYKQPNGQQICVIDLSDSDVEMSPELTRKGRKLSVHQFQSE